MIAGANYREGVANADGAVYVFGLATTALVPATATAKGALVPGGVLLTTDGAIYVRFV